MGSVKLKDLKAFVRYDGSGRVVSGSLVFRKKKPKNGRWVEITKNECCSETPSSTTTTTTTQGGGGVTPTAFIQSYWFNRNNACTSTTDGTLVFYSASSTISEGITVFTDAALTIPVPQGFVIAYQIGGAQYIKYVVGAGGVLSVLDCSNSFTLPFWYGINQSCTEPPQSPGIFYSVSNYLLPGSYMFTDAALTIPVPQGYVIRFGFQNYLVGEGGVLSYFSCPTTTTTTTQSLTFYNADYLFGSSGNPCIGTGQFNIPLVVDQGLNPCGGATVTLASGTWAGYGINPGSTILVNFGNQGNPGTVLQLNVFGTNSSSNFGCQSCG